MKNNTENHHFTVVIPTRERCDTLEHSLHTCVVQDYDNLEIIVSDNFSQDNTREVVESYKDSRIRYVNTGKRLSMTDNFEFALSHVKPEGYIIYIGDDDGLLPAAIRDINTVVTQTGARVLRWDIPRFWWPTLTNNKIGRLDIPSLGSGTTIRNSSTAIQNALSFSAGFGSLPLMYTHSAVEYKIIKRIKDLSGRFYHSITPDVYSGFAIAGAVDSFINSRRPYAIAGCSHHSIGASVSCDSASYEPARKFFSENNLPFHSSLVISGSVTVVTAECFLQARDHLPFFQEFTLDMQQLLFKTMEEAASKPQDFYIEVKDAVLRIGQMHNIPEAAQRAIAANPKRDRKITVRNPVRTGLSVMRRGLRYLYGGCVRNGVRVRVRDRVALDCSSLNVKNIYDACLLCDHILRLNDMDVFKS